EELGAQRLDLRFVDRRLAELATELLVQAHVLLADREELRLEQLQARADRRLLLLVRVEPVQHEVDAPAQVLDELLVVQAAVPAAPVPEPNPPVCQRLPGEQPAHGEGGERQQRRSPPKPAAIPGAL